MRELMPMRRAAEAAVQACDSCRLSSRAATNHVSFAIYPARPTTADKPPAKDRRRSYRLPVPARRLHPAHMRSTSEKCSTERTSDPRAPPATVQTRDSDAQTPPDWQAASNGRFPDADEWRAAPAKVP